MLHKGRYINTPWGERVKIDLGIITLIKLVWALGIRTEFSCQDHHGVACVGFPTPADAVLFYVCATYASYTPMSEVETLLREVTYAEQVCLDLPDVWELRRRTLDWRSQMLDGFEFRVPRPALIYVEFPCKLQQSAESNLLLAQPYGLPPTLPAPLAERFLWLKAERDKWLDENLMSPPEDDELLGATIQ